MLKKGDTGTIADRMWAVVHPRTRRVYRASTTTDVGMAYMHLAVYSNRTEAVALRKKLVTEDRVPAVVVRLNDVTFTVL